MGCYLDMLNRFPVMTGVQEAFTALGIVVHSQAGMGIGIKFTGVEDRQQAVLDRWLADAT
jgi:hypothetical protein